MYQGVEQFMQGDGFAGLHALGEIITFEHLGQSEPRGQADPALPCEVAEPFAVEADPGLLRIQDLEDLGLVGLGIGQDFCPAEGRARGLLPRGVADEAREVADEEGDLVAELLELCHLADEHAVTEMQIRRRGIETRLDPEGPALLQLHLQLFDLVAGHGALGEQGQVIRYGSGSSRHA